jgi:hypothetical protein
MRSPDKVRHGRPDDTRRHFSATLFVCLLLVLLAAALLAAAILVLPLRFAAILLLALLNLALLLHLRFIAFLFSTLLSALLLFLAPLLFLALLFVPLLFVPLLFAPLLFVVALRLVMALRLVVALLFLVALRLVVALLLMAGLVAFPLRAHVLFVAQALGFPLFPCQTFALHTQAFALRRQTLTFQHLAPLVVVAIPLGLPVCGIVVVIAILIIRGGGIRCGSMMTAATGQRQACRHEYQNRCHIQSGHGVPPGMFALLRSKGSGKVYLCPLPCFL